MWFLVIVIYILAHGPPIDGRKQKGQSDTSTRAPDDEDMMYQHLSPEAFFSMKENQPSLGPERPLLGPIGPGMGSIGPDMGPMGPGMGPMGPGMGPGRGAGMGRPRRPMGPMKPGMRPAAPGRPMGPMRPGMRPINRPGMEAGKQPVTEPMGPGMRPQAGPTHPGMKVPEGTETRDGKKSYEHFDLSILDDMSRQSKYKENYAEEIQTSTTGDDLIIYNLCFCLSYMWRRGRESIRKYFHLRDIYHNHLPYEIGYLTHVIMSKYQTMLELYEYSHALAKKKRGTITRLHLTHFLKSFEQDGKTISHLCNMMHEIKAKYDAQPYDPGNRFDIPPSTPNVNTTTTETMAAEFEHKLDNIHGRHGKGHGPFNGKLDKAFLAKKIEESHKVIDKTVAERKKKMKAAREFYKKHGYYPTSTHSQQPMRLWSPNLDYGWSGEDDW